MRDYKKYEIWKKAHKLSISVYGLTQNFPSSEKYGLTSQLRRAVTSIAINIVEGSGRSSDKDFSNFLYIAAASAGETEYILHLSVDLKIIDNKTGNELIEETNHLRRMIYNFIKSLSN